MPRLATNAVPLRDGSRSMIPVSGSVEARACRQGRRSQCDLRRWQLRRPSRRRRPALVVSSTGYLANVPDLVIVLPITTVDRRWPHHVPVHGDWIELEKPSFAMTEQPRTVSMQRIDRHAGAADARTLAEVDQWLRDLIASWGCFFSCRGPAGIRAS